jgi:hypothetical protein
VQRAAFAGAGLRRAAFAGLQQTALQQQQPASGRTPTPPLRMRSLR